MNLHQLLGLNPLSFTKDKLGRWQDYFGIELELEDVRMNDATTSLWELHNDQSLRNAGVEFVTRGPTGGQGLAAALDQFFNSPITYTNGPRTSTHIHLNMTDTTLEHLRVMLCIVYAIEDSLFNVVGESRKWTGYAMPLSEMDPNRLRSIMSGAPDRLLLSELAPSRNQERYYGCNTAALRRFGTLEFRYFPGGPSRSELESWLDLFFNIKENTRRLTIADLERIEGISQFLSLLSDVLGYSWSRRLVSDTTMNEMYDKFIEIVAMAETDSPDRRERLVFLNPQLLTFMGRKVLTDKAKFDWFRRQVEPLRVISQNDFVYYTRIAQQRTPDGGVGMNTVDVDPFSSGFAYQSAADLIRRQAVRRTAQPRYRMNENGEAEVYIDPEAETIELYDSPVPAEPEEPDYYAEEE